MFQMFAQQQQQQQRSQPQQSSQSSGSTSTGSTTSSTTAPVNPFAALFSNLQQQGNNPFAQMFAPQQQQQQQQQVRPEILYRAQLSALNEMGFYDAERNIAALIATGGNVQAAVERLLTQ